MGVDEPKPQPKPPWSRPSLGRALMPLAGLVGNRFRPVIKTYALTPPGFPSLERPIRIAALADVHACKPWMTIARIEEIVAAANRLEPDLVVLLGDYVCAIFGWKRGVVPMSDWARALSGLKAPLGVFAVLGNHDWRAGGEEARAALEAHGVPVMENDVRLLRPDDGPAFWLAGLADQRVEELGRGRFVGRDDLPGTLARIDEDAPVILLAHEPDIFLDVPHRVSLTLSGHTHGGQCRFPVIGAPVAPSRYGQRYA